ncbi:GNAT family N-acetyltransferase [Rhodococcus triatomae]|uniref:Acetyltransferase (GNAT) family protein n=1 Tax=Rhodococcus triatomae TaxID=300028 RepID=A0A1G8GYC5_9NOCA|nr:GNAT family N-acetyltransferase [Rhodococcus triatomae]QNG20261.1 GNAT family N-acetyltransferase [Rhodococcus triatomae]QNG23824.1 GNAT family N-acetyltransferase [Rhodococcus triatomae]SDH99403.1 Acetyltransferase (GNAT) family protein [Rhodococcus triatomae]
MSERTPDRDVVVRTFIDTDRPELLALFERAGEGSPSGTLWGHTESEAAVYLTPYMDLEPESLFVAVVDGELAGYLAGCTDSARFPSESERMEAAIRRYRLVFRRRPAAFFARSIADMVWAKLRRIPAAGEFQDARWPAHLHIDLVPEARGRGVGGALMRRWLDRLEALGVPGCHLQTLVENEGAVRFFESSGFVPHGEPRAVPGVRYRGNRVRQRDMVWTAP